MTPRAELSAVMSPTSQELAHPTTRTCTASRKTEPAGKVSYSLPVFAFVFLCYL